MTFKVPAAIVAGAALSGAGFMAYVNWVTDAVRSEHLFSQQQANAFAHAYASAVLTQMLRENAAKTIGDMREEYFSNGINNEHSWDNFKDLFNNEIGRQIGVYALQNDLSDQKVQDIIAWEVSRRGLVIDRNDPRIEPGFDGHPINFDTGVAVWAGPSSSQPFSPIRLTYPPVSRCFLAGTEIQVAGGGSVPIEDIAVGSDVLCFAGGDTFNKIIARSSELTVSKVVRTFRNTSTVILRINYIDAGHTRDLFVTPEHVFLTSSGFRPVYEALLAGDSLILGRGIEVEVKFEVISCNSLRYGHVRFDGSFPEPGEFGWTTYNFEVHEHNTYIAGGFRVHNYSILDEIDRLIDEDPSFSINSQLSREARSELDRPPLSGPR